MTDNKYLTVTDLNYYITQKFKNDPYLHKVFLQGELSNFRYRRNSHQYFSLKDEKSKINVVMFRSYFDKVKFKPEEGMAMLAFMDHRAHISFMRRIWNRPDLERFMNN